jgi:hypothetical protein
LDGLLGRLLQEFIDSLEVGRRCQQHLLGEGFSSEPLDKRFKGNIRKCLGEIGDRNWIVAGIRLK